MKKNLSALAACCLIFFTSCDKDISVEYGELNPNPVTVNASNLSNCKDCSYSPVCSGSVYRYSDTSAGVATTQNYTLQYLKDTMILGRTYQKIRGGAQQVSYFNCSSGMSTSIILNGGGSFVKTTNLKANQSVGYNWSDVITGTSGQPTAYGYTIMAKGIQRTVSGKTYTDVIHVHERTSLNMPGVAPIPVERTDYYFAKGTGLIESITLDENSGQKTFHHVLLSANIP